jgi:integrase
MATVNFLYRSTKDEAPLILRLLFRHKEIDYVFGAKTKIIVSKHYWFKQHKQVRFKKANDIDAFNDIQSIKDIQTSINSELYSIEKHILDVFNKVTNPITITKDWLKKEIDYYYNPKQEAKHIPTDLISFIDYYIEQRKDEVKPTSIKKYYVVKHKMERFQVYRGKQIYIDDINEDFKKEFVRYYKAESYSKNTMHRELVILKTFCKYARRKGVEVHLELDGLRLDRGKAIIIYLSFDELETIGKTVYVDDYLINARDWLIISCYTGQRVSDFMRFTKDMIRVEDGKKLIEFQQYKTDKLMTVPLHPKVIEILNKRSGEFPRPISDQRYNEYIKIVCEDAEINERIKGKKQSNISKDKKISKIRNVVGIYPKHELVTSHIGRRSFSSNFYGTIPTTLLINVTGHSTEAMFLNYIGKSNKDLAMELTKYF